MGRDLRLIKNFYKLVIYRDNYVVSLEIWMHLSNLYYEFKGTFSIYEYLYSAL